MAATLTNMPRPAKPESTSVRMRSDLYRMLRVIGTFKEIDLPDLLYQMLRKKVEAEYKRIISDEHAAHNKPHESDS